MKPLATRKNRQWLLALADAKQLQESDIKDVAEFLAHFEGYPEDDAGLEACEREMFISAESAPGAYEVPLPVSKNNWVEYTFKTEDEAYAFFCKRYNDYRRYLDIPVTQFGVNDIAWAREYWKALSEEDLAGFYFEATEGKNRYWNGVNEYTTYLDYLVISARQSDYERRHDI